MSTARAPLRFDIVPSIHEGSDLGLHTTPTRGVVRVCIRGPRGGFMGEAYVRGQLLANALAHIGFEADSRSGLTPLAKAAAQSKD